MLRTMSLKLCHLVMFSSCFLSIQLFSSVTTWSLRGLCLSSRLGNSHLATAVSMDRYLIQSDLVNIIGFKIKLNHAEDTTFGVQNVKGFIGMSQHLNDTSLISAEDKVMSTHLLVQVAVFKETLSSLEDVDASFGCFYYDVACHGHIRSGSSAFYSTLCFCLIFEGIAITFLEACSRSEMDQY